MTEKSLSQRAKGEERGLRSRSVSQRGGILLWLAMCFVLVCGVVVMGGVFFAHNIRVQQRDGNDVRVDTPFGSVHVRHNTNGRPETAGIPLYPGAKPRRNGENATVDLSELFGDQGLHIVAGKWFTDDSMDKVSRFYRDKFPEMSVIQHDNKIELHAVTKQGKKIIVLCRMHEGTEIALASVGEPKAN